MASIFRTLAAKALPPLLHRLHGAKSRLVTYHGTPKAHQGNFSRQCKWLRDEYRPVSLDEYVSALDEGRALPPRSIVVTFDDGLLSVYQYGLEILVEHKIPAIVYVVPAFVEGRIWLWWHLIEYALTETSKNRLDIELEGGGRFTYELAGADSRRRAVADILSRLHRRNNHKTLGWAEAIAAEAGVSIPACPPAEHASMNWTQLKELNANGILIGSHTVNHKIVGTLPDWESRRFEIAGSKREIESAMGRPCPHFSFPNGGLGDFSMEDIDLVRAAGYRSAVTTLIGMSYTDMDPFQLPRINAGVEVELEFLRRKVAGWFFHAGGMNLPRRT